MQSLRGWILALVVLAAIVAASIALSRSGLFDHDLDGVASEQFYFESDGNRLSGTLWLPDVPPIAAVVLVHGDGPQDRTSGGGYAPLIKVFLEAGIAVASWDKPGIGDSHGQWLDQSMVDRAQEVSAGLSALVRRVEDTPVGAIGFSQAGWVLPRLRAGDADFLVLVGPAVSWRQQGEYYTATRLRRAGATEPDIRRAIAKSRPEDDRIFGDGAPYDAGRVPDDISEARWGFIKRNRNEDAWGLLVGLDAPVYAIWGRDDLNVDAMNDSDIYRRLLEPRNVSNCIVVIPDATHGLLRAEPYNMQLVEEWTLPTTLRYFWAGRDAFAPGALEGIVAWISAQTDRAANGPEVCGDRGAVVSSIP